MRRALAAGLAVAVMIVAAAIAAVRMHRSLEIPDSATDVEGTALPLEPGEIAAAVDALDQEPYHAARQHPLLAATAVNVPPPPGLSNEALVAPLEYAAPEPVLVELADRLREPRAALGALLTPSWLAEVVARCPGEAPREFAGLCGEIERAALADRVEEELSRMLGSRRDAVAIGAAEAACGMGEAGARVGDAAVAGRPEGESPRQQAAMGQIVLDCTTSRDESIRRLVQTLDADGRDAWVAALELGRLEASEGVDALKRYREVHRGDAAWVLTGYFLGELEKSESAP